MLIVADHTISRLPANVGLCAMPALPGRSLLARVERKHARLGRAGRDSERGMHRCPAFLFIVLMSPGESPDRAGGPLVTFRLVLVPFTSRIRCTGLPTLYSTLFTSPPLSVLLLPPLLPIPPRGDLDHPAAHVPLPCLPVNHGVHISDCCHTLHAPPLCSHALSCLHSQSRPESKSSMEARLKFPFGASSWLLHPRRERG